MFINRFKKKGKSKMFEHHKHKMNVETVQTETIKNFMEYFKEVKESWISSVKYELDESPIDEWENPEERESLKKSLEKFEQFEFDINSLMNFFDYWMIDRYWGYSTSDCPPLSRWLDENHPEFSKILDYV